MHTTKVMELISALLSDDSLDREVQVRFWNYEKKKWSKAKKNTVVHNMFSTQTWSVTNNLTDVIKTPKRIVRVRVRVRHVDAASKQVPFKFFVDRARLLVN